MYTIRVHTRATAKSRLSVSRNGNTGLELLAITFLNKYQHEKASSKRENEHMRAERYGNRIGSWSKADKERAARLSLVMYGKHLATIATEIEGQAPICRELCSFSVAKMRKGGSIFHGTEK